MSVLPEANSQSNIYKNLYGLLVNVSLNQTSYELKP